MNKVVYYIDFTINDYQILHVDILDKEPTTIRHAWSAQSLRKLIPKNKKTKKKTKSKATKQNTKPTQNKDRKKDRKKERKKERTPPPPPPLKTTKNPTRTLTYKRIYNWLAG